MVLFLLYIKADLDGVGKLSLKPDANVSISVRNPLSDFEVRDKVAFNIRDTLEQDDNSREPPCHFALKWDGNQKRSILEVLDGAATKAALKKKKKKGIELKSAYTSDDNGDWTPILAMECRGLEPYAYHPLGDEFVVESEGGVTFDTEVDLSDGDWAEYDEENDAAVSVSEFETKFESV